MATLVRMGLKLNHWRFQSTPPSRVATLQRQPIVPPMPNFNPHHPRGWRPAAALYESDVVHISIHTTLAGGDLYGKWIYRSCLFISIHTTLAGGDLGFSTAIELDNQFQSTPPSRVATLLLQPPVAAIPISIHTTLAGGDMSDAPTLLMCNTISIHTTLAGGDFFFLLFYLFPSVISIHTTLAGGDVSGSPIALRSAISIHTTLAGGDNG